MKDYFVTNGCVFADGYVRLIFRYLNESSSPQEFRNLYNRVYEIVNEFVVDDKGDEDNIKMIGDIIINLINLNLYPSDYFRYKNTFFKKDDVKDILLNPKECTLKICLNNGPWWNIPSTSIEYKVIVAQLDLPISYDGFNGEDSLHKEIKEKTNEIKILNKTILNLKTNLKDYEKTKEDLVLLQTQLTELNQLNARYKAELNLNNDIKELSDSLGKDFSPTDAIQEFFNKN